MPHFFQRFGLPDSPSYIPSPYMGYSEEMTLFERVFNYFLTKSLLLLLDIYQWQPDNQMLKKKFGKDFPDIRDLVKNTTSLMLLNTHFSIQGARPTTPNVLELAGVHVFADKPKELSPDLKKLLDSSESGVILVSFGSTVRLSSLPTAKRDLLMNVFGKLKQTVLMKWENNSEVIENIKPDNVHFLSWLPQKQILAHPNVKVFFAHGGLMGMLEALANKVPVVGAPMFGDQYVNVAAINYRKAGILLNYVDWNEKSLMNAVSMCLSQE